MNYAPIYDGQWILDKRHGNGTAYYKNGAYEGQWKDDCREGLGIMCFHNGSYYIGEWKNNLFDGIGAYYGFYYVVIIPIKPVNYSNLDSGNGIFYKGYYRNGIKSGEGTQQYILQNEIQKGIWIDGRCVTSVLKNIDKNENILDKPCIPEVSNEIQDCSFSLQIRYRLV